MLSCIVIPVFHSPTARQLWWSCTDVPAMYVDVHVQARVTICFHIGLTNLDHDYTLYVLAFLIVYEQYRNRRNDEFTGILNMILRVFAFELNVKTS